MTITRKAQTGEPGNKGQFGSKLNTDAEATLERPQPRLMHVADIEVGDELWVSGGFAGLVSSIEDSKTHRVLIFSDGTWYQFAASERVEIVRTSLPLPYDPDTDYLQRCESARDYRQSAEVLERIASAEAEDGLIMHAVAGHPNATPEAIDQATKHQFLLARMAAARNPNTSDGTLDRLMAEASESEIDAMARHRAEGTNPDSQHPRLEAKQHAGIVAAIHQRPAG